MKITIATGPIFPVPALRGGAVQRLWEGLAREFAKRGHEVTIFAREFPGQPKEEIVDGIRFVRWGGYEQTTSIKRDLVQCLIYAMRAARRVPAGDVVVTNDFWMPAVLPWLKASAGRVVVNANRFPKNQYWLYGKAAAFAAASAVVAQSIKKQQPAAARWTAVVPNAIDEVFLKETKRQSDEKTAGGRRLETGDRRQVAAATNGPRYQGTKGPRDEGTTGQQDDGSVEHGKEKETGDRGQEAGRRQTADRRQPVRILYVGRIHPEKGVGLLANALRLLAARGQETKRERDQETKRPKDEGTSWECVIVGPVKQNEGGGGEAFAGEMKRQLEGLPVRFLPPVYELDALAAIYDAADIFVYPSVAETGESFGIAPLEAMARGVVPVVSNLLVFREYLEPGVNGIVFDHRSGEAVENLAAALRDLVEDADKRCRMGPAARLTAERFSPSAIADKYLQLFEKVISGSWS